MDKVVFHPSPLRFQYSPPSLLKALDFFLVMLQIAMNSFPPEGLHGFSPRRKSKIREDVIAMICTVVKKGVECAFMTNKGCQFLGGKCKTVVEQCEGCQKVAEFDGQKYCLSFPDPQAKWRVGKCNMATHIKEAPKAQPQKLNPLKASKRQARG